MSPRPAASRHDATAKMFLDAGAQLIDALLAQATNHPRLARMHYPAALEWIRIEDVIRMTAGRPGASEKALRNRWPQRDDYLRDCFLHALLYNDTAGASIDALTAALLDTNTPLNERIHHLATDLVNQLLENPRSYLLAHAAPMVSQDPDIHAALTQRVNRDMQRWTRHVTALLDAEHLHLRPDWTPERLVAVIHVIIDGIVIRHRLDIPMPDGSQWQAAPLAADTITTLITATIDTHHDSESSSHPPAGNSATPGPSRG